MTANKVCVFKGFAVVPYEYYPDGSLLIRKVCATNLSVTLQNAEFKITYSDGTFIGDSNGIYITDENGEIRIEGLKPGKSVIVTEVKAPAGFIIDTQSQTIQIKEGRAVSLTFKNQPKGSLIIQKRDSQTGEALPGAEFRITTAAGCEVGLNGVIGTSTLTSNGIFTTDARGEIRISNLAPGAYVITEIKALDGYVIDRASTNVVIGQGGDTQTVIIKNTKKGNLVIEKYNSVTRQPLPGARFKVTTASGEFVADNEGLTSSNGLYTTDQNGQIILSKLLPGTYVVTEDLAPDNYQLDPNPQTVVVYAGDTQVLRFYDDPLCTLTLIKRDAVTKKPLQGAEFLVKDSSGRVIGPNNGLYITGSDGTVTVSGLTPNSTVVVSEQRAPSGYVLDQTPQNIVVRSGVANSLIFDDQPGTTLVIWKFIEGTDYEPLAGVAFKVTDGSGAAVDPDGGIYYTDHAGEIVLEGIEPGTTVIAREIKTVEGFVLDGAPQTIKIVGGQVQQLTFWNKKAGTLVIQKKDSVTGKLIPGAQFQLTYANGGYVDADNGHLSSNGLYTTNQNGEIRISGIVGTVVAKEVQAAPGYVIDPATQTQTVTVNPTDTQILTFYNKPLGGLELIKVSESDSTRRIPGVTFEIRKMDGALAATVTTGSTGRACVELDAGDYYAVETVAAQGFKLDSTPHYFTVRDGKTTTLTVKNKPLSGILIHKTDSITGKGIPGATFLLYDSTFTPIGQYVSDNSGFVYIDNLTQSGRYYLRELANDGYIVDTQLKTVYVVAGETTLVEWQNTPITGQIQIVKTSADYNSINGWPAGSPIPGTEFEIYDYRTGNLVDTVRTDKNGIAVSRPLPLGRYRIVESKPADFYVPDKTPIEAELEYAGQIVRAAMTNKSVYTNVSIQKTGYYEVMAGQNIRYTFSGIGNNSNTALTSFYWRDALPVEAVRLAKITTGTYNAPGNYKVVYKTNLSGGEYRTMYDNLSTAVNYTLDASPAALGLASNEYVTEFMLVFGVVPAGFRQVEAPKVDCTVLSTVLGGSQFTNTADVGGVYNGQWIQAVTRWTTTVYGKPAQLPKTGY